jgi:hypothetical protein
MGACILMCFWGTTRVFFLVQVKELEERLEYADTQSAAMLEKVNVRVPQSDAFFF